jgi:hypothetical protein
LNERDAHGVCVEVPAAWLFAVQASVITPDGFANPVVADMVGPSTKRLVISVLSAYVGETIGIGPTADG